MANYSVKQIAEMLDTNPETVRRWIRAGRLESSQASKKDGNVISEEALKAFLECAPKYAAAASAAAGILSSAFPGIGIGTSLAMSAGVSVANALTRHGRRKEETADDVRENLIRLQIEQEKLLEQKQAALRQLQEQLIQQEQQLQEEKRQLQQLQRLVRELDLSQNEET